jgi:hypothetical protein
MMKNLIERRKPELVKAMDEYGVRYPHSIQRMMNSFAEKVSILQLSLRELMDLKEMMNLEEISFRSMDTLFDE